MSDFTIILFPFQLETHEPPILKPDQLGLFPGLRNPCDSWLHFCRVRRAIKIAIGSSLIAAGITGWVVFAYVLISQTLSDRVRIVTEFGLTAAFETRSVHIKQEYDRRLQNVDEAIDIMGYGLQSLRQDYRNDFKRWRNRANVRILLLDPTFPVTDHSYAAQRDKEERDDSGNIEKNVHRFLEEVQPLLESTDSHTFEVRLYRCLPSLNIFRIDSEMFWGPYLIGQPSRSNPTFLAHKSGLLFPRFLEHFNEIWTNPELSISVQDYQKNRQANSEIV